MLQAIKNIGNYVYFSKDTAPSVNVAQGINEEGKYKKHREYHYLFPLEKIWKHLGDEVISIYISNLFPQFYPRF